MRVANKNELFALMEDRAFTFAGFLLTDPGKEMNLLVNNLTGYDFDLPVMQMMFKQLLEIGVLDAACLERFAEFGKPVTDTIPAKLYTYRVKSGYTIPKDADVVVDTTSPDTLIITVSEPIDGLEGIS